MSLVFWDTMLFVYLVEENPQFHRRVSGIRTRMLDRGDRLCTSVLTLGELLALPYAHGSQELAQIGPRFCHRMWT